MLVLMLIASKRRAQYGLGDEASSMCHPPDLFTAFAFLMAPAGAVMPLLCCLWRRGPACKALQWPSHQLWQSNQGKSVA